MTRAKTEVTRLRQEVRRLNAVIDALVRKTGDYNLGGSAGGSDVFREPPRLALVTQFPAKCGWDADGEHVKVVFMTEREIYKLPEYSTTLPTGTTIGKKWKADKNARRYPEDRTPNPDWRLAEYYDINDPDRVGIRWAKIIITGGLLPGQQTGTATPLASGILLDR